MKCERTIHEIFSLCYMIVLWYRLCLFSFAALGVVLVDSVWNKNENTHETQNNIRAVHQTIIQYFIIQQCHDRSSLQSHFPVVHRRLELSFKTCRVQVW